MKTVHKTKQKKKDFRENKLSDDFVVSSFKFIAQIKTERKRNK